MPTVGSRIRHAQQALGLSVDALAQLLGKNRATVYRYESDEIANFPIEIVGKLAIALHTTPAHLMGWEAEEVSPQPGSEISEIFTQLSNENRAKILELSRLYLDHQQKAGNK